MHTWIASLHQARDLPGLAPGGELTARQDAPVWPGPRPWRTTRLRLARRRVKSASARAAWARAPKQADERAHTLVRQVARPPRGLRQSPRRDHRARARRGRARRRHRLDRALGTLGDGPRGPRAHARVTARSDRRLRARRFALRRPRREPGRAGPRHGGDQRGAAVEAARGRHADRAARRARSCTHAHRGRDRHRWAAADPRCRARRPLGTGRQAHRGSASLCSRGSGRGRSRRQPAARSRACSPPRGRAQEERVGGDLPDLGSR